MIPWLMEEHLLQAPEELAYNVGNKEGDNGVSVIAVDRSKLESWQHKLAEHGQTYSALVPEFFALPWQQGQMSLGFSQRLSGDNRCLARFGQWQGATGSPELILALVRIAQAGLTNAGNSASVVVYFDGEKPLLEADESADWRFQKVTDVFSPVHSEWLSIDEASATRPGIGWTLPAKVAAALVVVMLGLLVSTSLVETRRIAQQVEHLQSQLRQGYRQYFRQDYDFAMADFQRVVSSRLGGNSSGNSSGASASALGKVSQLAVWLQGCADCQLDKLDIRDGALSASLSGESVEQQLASIASANRQLSLQAMDSSWQFIYRGDMTNE